MRLQQQAAWSLRDAIKMVWLRGNLMHNAVPAGKGGMAAVLGLSGDSGK